MRNVNMYRCDSCGRDSLVVESHGETKFVFPIAVIIRCTSEGCHSRIEFSGSDLFSNKGKLFLDLSNAVDEGSGER